MKLAWFFSFCISCNFLSPLLSPPHPIPSPLNFTYLKRVLVKTNKINNSFSWSLAGIDQKNYWFNYYSFRSGEDIRISYFDTHLLFLYSRNSLLQLLSCPVQAILSSLRSWSLSRYHHSPHSSWMLHFQRRICSWYTFTLSDLIMGCWVNWVSLIIINWLVLLSITFTSYK